MPVNPTVPCDITNMLQCVDLFLWRVLVARCRYGTATELRSSLVCFRRECVMIRSPSTHLSAVLGLAADRVVEFLVVRYHDVCFSFTNKTEVQIYLLARKDQQKGQ